MLRFLLLMAATACVVPGLPLEFPTDQELADVPAGFDTSDDVPEESWGEEQDEFENPGQNFDTHVTGDLAFTSRQSPLCDRDKICVPWIICIDGFIDTSRLGQLEIRRGDKRPPASLDQTPCGSSGNVCCGIPADPLNQYPGGGGVRDDGVRDDGVRDDGGSVNGGSVNGGGGGNGGGEVGFTDDDDGVRVSDDDYGVRVSDDDDDDGVRVSDDDDGVVVSDDDGVGFSDDDGVGFSDDDGVGFSDDDGVGFSDDDGVGFSDDDGVGFSDDDEDGFNDDDGVGVSGVSGIFGDYGVDGGDAVEGIDDDDGVYDGGDGGGSIAESLTCSPDEDCVPLIQCKDGVINTDGVRLVDLRRGKTETEKKKKKKKKKKKENKKTHHPKCLHREDPALESVCCRLPDGPPGIPICPDYSVCTDRADCDERGIIVPDPYSGPAYTSSVKCQHRTYPIADAVCCRLPDAPHDAQICPENSICTFRSNCDINGFIARNPNYSSDYTSSVKLLSCDLPGLLNDGVCCANPPPEIKVEQQCGVAHYGTKDASVKSKIHGTKLKLEADFGELPWQAIVFFANLTFKCGASLISDKYLLTAAHCVAGLYPRDVIVRVGEWRVNTTTEPLPHQDIVVKSIKIHPDYKPDPHWNNIAIIELAKTVKIQYNINSICLPFGGVATSFPPGTPCIVSGWGKNSFRGKYRQILKKIEVSLLDHKSCQTQLRNTPRLGKHFRLHNSYLCAGGEEGKDACVGDGGGPLICYNEASQSYVQVGLTAWGIGCGAKDVPGVYTDVKKLVSWISKITGIGRPTNVGNRG